MIGTYEDNGGFFDFDINQYSTLVQGDTLKMSCAYNADLLNVITTCYLLEYKALPAFPFCSYAQGERVGEFYIGHVDSGIDGSVYKRVQNFVKISSMPLGPSGDIDYSQLPSFFPDIEELIFGEIQAVSVCTRLSDLGK